MKTALIATLLVVATGFASAQTAASTPANTVKAQPPVAAEPAAKSASAADKKVKTHKMHAAKAASAAASK
jgi:outer membrane lipoprotein-sorting protein